MKHNGKSKAPQLRNKSKRVEWFGHLQKTPNKKRLSS
jgi:hypothetical protein